MRSNAAGHLCGAAAGVAEGDLVVPPVIACGEFDDQLAPRRYPCGTAGQVHRFAAGIKENNLAQFAGKSHQHGGGGLFRFMGERRHRPIAQCDARRIHHCGVRVTEHACAKTQGRIDIACALHIPQVRALRAQHLERLAINFWQSSTSAGNSTDKIVGQYAVHDQNHAGRHDDTQGARGCRHRCGESPWVAAGFHDRNHHLGHCASVGSGQAGQAAINKRCRHVDQPQAAAQATEAMLGDAHDT